MVNGRKAAHGRREIVVRPPVRGTRRDPGSRGATRESAPRGALKDIPLREHTEVVLSAYFEKLNGHRPARLYELVLREVEEPLFRAVMGYADGNQSRAAGILGINRGTLRKKLREYGLAD